MGNKIKIIITVLVLFSLLNKSLAQYFQSKNYPTNYFQSPVEIPLQLSANFGEVRSNHFHMGLDIRTNQKENYKVLAAAEGYVSRIIIEPYGYGRAIYITHPNGYTTVYGHLNEFYEELEKEIIAKQYEGMQWEQDIEFPINKYRISIGQFIAFSGNTGGSQGPHLHFEIRDNKTGNTLNPLLFGLNVLDNIPPKLYNLFYYDRNFSTYEKGPEKIKIKLLKSGYETEDSILKVETNKISFGIQAEDRTNNSPFYFGIYQSEIWLDDTLKTAFQLDNISYSSSRFVNGCFDYKTKAENGPIIQHLSRLPGNYSAIFSDKISNGIIELNDTLIHTIQINIYDVLGNISTLKTNIQFQPNNNSSISNYDSYLFPNSKNYITTSECIIEFENSSFYDKVPYNYKSLNATEEFVVSNEHEPLSNNIPINESFKIRIKANKIINTEWKDRVVMQSVNNKKFHSTKGKWIGDWYEAKFIDLEKFRLIVDSFPPNINPIGWNDSSNIDNNQLVLKVWDNEGTIQHFAAELDGNWLMFKQKADYFIYNFNEKCSLGWHNLKVSVFDVAGNQTIKYFSFNKLEPPVVKPKAKKKTTTKKKKNVSPKRKG